MDELSGKLDVFVFVAAACSEVVATCDSGIVEFCLFWFLKACLKLFVLEEVIFVELRIGLHEFHEVVDRVHGRAEKKRLVRVGAAFSSARTKALGDCMIGMPRKELLVANNEELSEVY